MEKKRQQASQGNEYWRGAAYAFINHRKCESFPCHATDDPDNFNCLFCFCPLYALSDACGGDFTYTDGGIKDCSGCTIPHDKDNYGYITERFNEIVELTKWVKTNKP